MSRTSAWAVDELSSALQAGLVLSKISPSTAASSGGSDSKEGSGGTTSGYDRWTVQDENKIEYGYLSKTGGKEGPKEPHFYITTAINYTNGPAHIGHAYEGTTSDVIARYARSIGNQSVYFVTGSDEHGQKIATTAADANQKPIDLCNKVKNRMKKKMRDYHHQAFNLEKYNI